MFITVSLLRKYTLILCQLQFPLRKTLHICVIIKIYKHSREITLYGKSAFQIQRAVLTKRIRPFHEQFVSFRVTSILERGKN